MIGVYPQMTRMDTDDRVYPQMTRMDSNGRGLSTDDADGHR
jgi:hypothetical protein